MCTRITQYSNSLEIAEAFELQSIVPFQPAYNLGPYQPILAILQKPGAEGRFGMMLQWGLARPSSDPRYLQKRHVYARAETALSRLSFQGGVKNHRCLVPVNGYYEWRETGYGKQPHYIQAVDRRPLLIAAIWERCISPQQTIIESCALLTTRANRDVMAIHDRMPLIVQPADASLWLDPEIRDPDQLARLLRPCPDRTLNAHPVSEAINQLDCRGPELIEPLPADPPRAGLSSLLRGAAQKAAAAPPRRWAAARA
jgi:putative SOS response-associated peptidase YedK